MIDEAPPCPRCGGSGEIEFNVTWNNDPQMDDSRMCTTCMGTGAVDKAHEWDEETT